MMVARKHLTLDNLLLTFSERKLLVFTPELMAFLMKLSLCNIDQLKEQRDKSERGNWNVGWGPCPSF